MKFIYWLRKLWFSVFPRKVGAKGFIPTKTTNLKAVGPLPTAGKSWASPRLKWLMLGNGPDPTNPPAYKAGVGDCVVAGLCHAIMAVGHFLQLSYSYTATQAVNAYFALTGGTDSGLNPPGVLEEWEAGSLPAAAAAIWGKSGELVTLDPQNIQQIKNAIATFGWVGIGVNLQQAQETQFSSGQKWDYVKGSPDVGGHFVVLTGFTGVGPYTISWAKGFRSTWSFVTELAIEAYTGVIPPTLIAGKYVLSVATLDTICAGLPGA